MIHEYTILKMADNRPALRSALGVVAYRKRYASVGDIIVVAVHNVIPNGPLQEGQVAKAVVVRRRRNTVVPMDLHPIRRGRGCFDQR